MFREVWLIDFEFRAPPGEVPEVVCCAALEMVSGRRVRLWGRELTFCPFNPGPEALYVAYFASAEATCFRKLGWPMPCRWVDLYAEFRVLTNGRHPPAGNSLLGALAYYGLSGMAPAEKERLRDRIIAGGPFTSAEKIEILDYCESDTVAAAELLAAMEPEIAATKVRFNQALLRGRYAALAVSAMEVRGVPVNAGLLGDLRAHWDEIKLRLVEEVDQAFGVYEGTTFKTAKFVTLAEARGWDWPRLPSGVPSLEAKTFREMAETFPEIEPLRQLRSTLGELRLNDIAVGSDDRNRTLLSPFGAKTGRNTPSSSRFVFGPAVWARFLIQPKPGMAVAYLDFKCQEVAIGGAMSGDERLLEAALSGDPYLSFARSANLAPADATKETHGALRDRMKALVLGVGYGMQSRTLAFRLQVKESEARHLLRLYDEAYPRFAQWREEHLNRSLLGIRPTTIFGWTFEPDADTRPNTLRNWPVQSAGAEMLRWACCEAVERNVRLCAPIHDAVLIEAGVDDIEDEAARMRTIMREASSIVLGGVKIGVDTKIVRYPDHYTDKRGAELFGRVKRLLETLKQDSPTYRGWGPIGGQPSPIGSGVL